MRRVAPCSPTLLIVLDIVIRFPAAFQGVRYHDIQLMMINLLVLTAQAAVFGYGFIIALKGDLTLKRTGVIIAVDFVRPFGGRGVISVFLQSCSD